MADLGGFGLCVEIELRGIRACGRPRACYFFSFLFALRVLIESVECVDLGVYAHDAFW